MTRTIYDVLDELETDFRDLKHFLNHLNHLSPNDEDLQRIVKNLINEFMIPELKELTELLK